MKNKVNFTLGEVALTLKILECYLKYGPSLSTEDLCVKTRASEKNIRYVLLVLKKREYLIKVKNTGKTDKYALSKKFVMLI